MNPRYGSRKFIVTVLSLAVNALLVFERVIDGDTYKAIIIATVGAYLAANVWQRTKEGGA